MKRYCKRNPKRPRQSARSKTLRTKSFKRYFRSTTRAEKRRVGAKQKSVPMYLKSGKPTAWTMMVLGWYKQGKK